MTEHVLGPIDGDAQQVPCQSWGCMMQSLFFLSIMEINIWFCVCVCEEVGKVLVRIPEGTGTTWKT